MNPMTAAKSIVVKAFTAMLHPSRPSWWGHTMRRTRFDYRREVGDMLDSSVVTAPIQWLQRALPEARLAVTRRKQDGSRDDLLDHPMLALIQRPNPYYDDVALWAATILSLCTAGNGYWIKVRNGYGRPAELWYVPHWTMKPEGSRDGSVFLSHYRYSPGGGVAPTNIAPEDVVHFRHGIDPRDPRLGLPPLDGAIREIFVDLESSNFVASLIRVGTGAKLGLPVCLDRNTVVAAFLGGAREAVAPTVVVDADELEKNTVTLNSALNGSAVIVDLYETH